MKSILLLLAIQISFTLHEVKGNRNTIGCKAGTFTERQSVNVTCLFNVDIKQHRKNFNIVQYPSIKGSSSSDSGNYVLVCNWGAGTSLECKTEDGYSFDKNQVSDEVTLEIPNVSLSKAGVYVCQTVPDGGIPLETCNLSVTEKGSAPTTEKPCEECPNINCENSSILIILLTVCLTTLVLIVIMMCSGLYFRLNYRIVRKKTGDSAKKNGRSCCDLAVRKVTRQQDNSPDATEEESIPLNTVITKSEGNQGDGKKSTPLPLTAGAGSQAGSPSNTQKPVTDVNTARNPPASAVASGSTGHSTNEPSGPLLSKDPSLKKDESDKWTTDQVCQWLRQESLGIHVNDFKSHNVDGKRLHSFSYETGLQWYLGMSSGHDGKDRGLLIAKIDGLRRKVAERKKRRK